MRGWEYVNFADIIVESRDGEWGKEEQEPGHQLCTLIRGTDFSALYSSNTNLPVRWIKNHLVERKKLQSWDIIFEMAGGTAKQSTGRSALLTNSFFHANPVNPILCASFCRYLRINKDNYSPIFIYYLLQNLYIIGYMSVYNLQHTGISRFQYTSFKKQTKLLLPPLPIQRKIAAILSAYDDLIENNNRRIALLEKMAEELYREWFVRLRFPGHEKVKVVKGVPEGWEVRKIGEVVKYHIGGGWGEVSKKITNPIGAYVVRGTDIPALDQGKYVEPPYRYHKESNYQSRQLFVGDIVFEVSGGSKNQLLGRTLLVTKGIVNFCNNSLICASFCKLLRPSISSYFVNYFLKSYYNSGLCAMYQIQSTGISNYQFKSFLRYQAIVVPTNIILKLFDSIIIKFISQKDNLSKRNLYLKTTRDRLLTRLMSGKIDPNDLDISYPPSMREEE